MKNQEINRTKKENMFFPFLCMAFVTTLILSNISASNTINFGIINLSAAELLFPISYVINDLLSEFYSEKRVKKVVIIGLCMSLFATIFLYLTTLIPSNYVEYNTVFGFLTSGVVGITIASFCAYVIGSLINIKIMNIFKQKDKTQKFFKRAILSSIIAEFLDSLIFITGCCIFASNFYNWSNLISFVLTISSIKIVVELLVFPLTNFIRNKILKFSAINAENN